MEPPFSIGTQGGIERLILRSLLIRHRSSPWSTEKSSATVLKENDPFALKDSGFVTVTSIFTVLPWGGRLDSVNVGPLVASGVAPVTDHENERPDWSPKMDKLRTPKVSEVPATNNGWQGSEDRSTSISSGGM